MTLEELSLTCRRIFIRRLGLLARIGIYPHEIAKPQTLLVSAEVWIPREGLSDQIGDTLDYDRIADIIRTEAGAKHHNLIETVADGVAGRIFEFPCAAAVRVTVEKPHAVPDAECSGAEVFRIR